MPRGDRTGPQGMGPMTGRAAGFCAGNNVHGSMNPDAHRGGGMRLGRGVRRGGGFGFRLQQTSYPENASAQTPTTENEICILRQKVASLRATINAIDSRLQSFGAEPSEDA